MKKNSKYIVPKKEKKRKEKHVTYLSEHLQSLLKFIIEH